MISLIDNFNQVDMLNPSQDVIDIYKNIPEINEIDGRGYPICRPLFSHSDLPRSLGLKSLHINDYKDEDFIYSVHVHHNQKLWTEHLNLIPNSILDLIRKKRGFLLFDNTLEGNNIENEWFINPFYNSIRNLKLPSEKIIFVTNNLIAEKSHSKYKSKSKINIISFMWNVHDVKRLILLGHLPSKFDVKNEIKFKSKNIEKIKHFLKINRTPRPERNLFMLFMNHHKILDKALISFPDFPKEWYPDMFKSYTTKNNINSLKIKMPFDIDQSDKDNHGEPGQGKGFFDADLPFNPIHYKNSFISVVMGAFPFEEKACHLHSSTFNPLYCGHPIIQFGPLHSLKEMRERGFKTFSKWWDESYDDEIDGWLRLKKIMELILEISERTQKELLDMYIDMSDVLQHNSDLIKNYSINTHLYNRLFYDKS